MTPATCKFCGASIPTPCITRAGEFLCDDCAQRLPPCPVCYGSGMTLHGPMHTIISGDPCSECQGDGILNKDDTCPYAGRATCGDPKCQDCLGRAEAAAYERLEQAGKEARR